LLHVFACATKQALKSREASSQRIKNHHFGWFQEKQSLDQSAEAALLACILARASLSCC
jgi:hypothetical protein